WLKSEWVEDGMHGVEPERVDAVLLQPHQRAVDEEGADLVAVRTIEIDGVAPGSAVAAGDVRAEAPGDIPLRTEVVVDDVEDDGEPFPVGSVDEAPQALRPTVGILGGVREDPVVTPITGSGELRDRHQFDGGDTELFQVGQM